MEQIYRQPERRRSLTAVQAADSRSYGRYLMPVILLAVLFVAGCASLSKEECTAADWYAVGVEDGSKGYDMSRLGAHRKACAKVGVAPDPDRYAQGRLEGLKSFCTGERGYYEGERGRAYRGVCPADLEPVFMQGYLAGQEIYKARQQIRAYESELVGIRNEIALIRQQLETGVVVDEYGVAHEIGPYEKRAMLDRLLILDREEGRLMGEIATMQQSL